MERLQLPLPLVLLLAAAPWRAQDPQEAPPASAEAPPEESSILQVAPEGPFDLRVGPLVELFQEVRALAEERVQEPQEEVPEPAPDGTPPGRLDEAVAAALELAQELGPSPSARFFEAHLLGAEDASELEKSFRLLPEQAPRAGGEPARLRELAVALAGELAEVEEAWRAEVWPARRERLVAEAERLSGVLNGPQGARILADVERELDLRVPAQPLVIHLVTRAPRPGAITLRAVEGPVSFVALGDVEGDLDPSLAVEVVLHEALHGMDASAEERGSLFSRLRTGLEEAGVPARSALVRDAVHALFFVEAAELVRRHVDEGHVAYGEAREAYARLGDWPALWQELLPALGGGEEREAEVIARIVAAAAPQGAGTAGGSKEREGSD